MDKRIDGRNYRDLVAAAEIVSSGRGRFHVPGAAMVISLILDLRDARALLAELENPGRTNFCLECEQRQRRIDALEAQLAYAVQVIREAGL